MSIMPPSPFMNSAASFPAAAESGATAAYAPASSAAPEPIPEIFMGGAWHPAHELLAEPHSNSVCNVMLQADAAAILSSDFQTRAVAAVPIQVSDGVLATSPAEMEPSATLALASSGTAVIDPVREPVAAANFSSTLDPETGVEAAAGPGLTDPPVPAAADPQDLIDEIFIGARRLQPRELPPDFQERLLAAIESDVWADPAPLFLTRTR